MSDILVSGSTGFVGQNLIAHLEKAGHNIYRLHQFAKDEKQLSWKNVNEATKMPLDVFIHLAGKAHDVKNVSDASEYFEVNTELTKKFFNEFLKSTAETFIFMSTVKAAADSVEGLLTEDTIPDPKTAYGQSKQQAEAYILNAGLPAGKRVFILRPCMIHGPGNKGNLTLLYQFVQKGIPYPLAAFDNKRSFLSIGNLNYILEKIISDKSIPGGIYNLADDESLSTAKVIEIISEAVNLKPRLWSVSPQLIKKMALVGDKLRLPLNSERLKKLTESYEVSNNKIKKALGINQLPISSAQGLKITVQSFKTN